MKATKIQAFPISTWAILGKITQTGFVDVHRDYRNTHINVYSKTIDSEGILDLTRIKDGSISTENLFVRGGTFNQTNNIQTYAFPIHYQF